jgi:N-acetylmuramoyl-L-alanine amidase
LRFIGEHASLHPVAGHPKTTGLSAFSFLFAGLLTCTSVFGAVIRARGLPTDKTDVRSPDVQWVFSPNANNRNTRVRIDAVVIHTTETPFEGTLDVFQNPASQVSAHFVIAADGRIIQMVDTTRRAWHATYYNTRSIGIEMVGFARNSSTWNSNNLAALMDLLAWIVTAYDIPLLHPDGDAFDFPNNSYRSTGLIGHGQVQPWNRTDPGPFFPWGQVLEGTQQRIDAVPEPGSFAMVLCACFMLPGRCRSRPAIS